MNTYNYAGIDIYDINNGKGFGITVFVQGCSHHCKGCHNPSTWDFQGGETFDLSILKMLEAIWQNDNIVRLTLSGGEPFDNIQMCLTLASLFKQSNPQKQIWIYTGYTYEELYFIQDAANLLKMCDVLVDGPFMINKKDLSLPFRGSSNQRIIDIKKTLDSGDVTLYEV